MDWSSNVTDTGAVFWTKDESDADLNPMSRRSAHVPGVTDTATGAKKTDTMSRQKVVAHSKQRMGHRKGQAKTQASEKPTKEGKGNVSKQDERRSPSKEAPSLKDLRVEDKKRVANLIKELAKIGEEKEVALQQLQVERKENKMKTKGLHTQLAAILKERENIQLQYLDCQKLLSSYQTKVSENQEKLSNSLHERSSHIPHKENASHSGWSPIKESSKMIPVSYPPSQDSQQKFFQLQPIPDQSPAESNQCATKTSPISNNVFQPSRDALFHKHQERNSQFKDGADQFNPVLSSTYRQQHQSRVTTDSTRQETEAVQSGLSNALSRKQQRMYELSPAVASSKNKRRQPHNGLGSLQQTIPEPGSRNRLSPDTFLPLQEVTDFTKSSDDPDQHARVQRSSERVPQSDGWASLPEMNGNLPSTVLSHLKESSGVDDPRYRSYGPQGIEKEDENNEEWEDYQGLPPQQRQQTLGSVRDRLQQEQDWLQHKLLQQEKLLHEKQLEIQMQKLQLSQPSQQQLMDSILSSGNDTGYENVRRKYLQQSKTDSPRQGGVGGPIYRRGEDPVRQDVHIRIPADGQGGARPVGQNHAPMSTWEQHPVSNGVLDMEEQASTKFPPEGIEQYGQRTDQQYSTMQEQVYWDQRYGQRDEEYFDIDDDDDEDYVEEEEEDGDAVQAWYETREEMEAGNGRDSIQGYASLHPRGERRRGATEQPFRGHDPTQQIGNITAILDAETREAVHSSAVDRDYRMPGAQHGQQAMTAVPNPEFTGVPRTRSVPQGYVHGVPGSIPHTGVTGHVPQDQRAASMHHREVGDGLPHQRTANRVPRNIGLPHAGVMGHVPHDQRARTRPGVADDMLPQGISGSVSYPRTTESIPQRRLPHTSSTHGVPHPLTSGNIPQSRIPRHGSTNDSIPYQYSHIYPDYHQEDVEPFTSRVGPEERSRPRGQKVSQDRVGQSPHHADRGSLRTGVPLGGYRTQGQGHGRNQTASDARLMQRSSQVIREIGLLLDQDVEVGEEEESRVLEDVFFLK